jgi:hypothetical protein
MSADIYYILKGKTPVICRDLIKWADWFQTHDRRVAKQTIGDYWISTVFLGLDHGFGGKPLLFETMVFERRLKAVGETERGEVVDEYTRRYLTWEEALEGHEATIKLIIRSTMRVVK